MPFTDGLCLERQMPSFIEYFEFFDRLSSRCHTCSGLFPGNFPFIEMSIKFLKLEIGSFIGSMFKVMVYCTGLTATVHPSAGHNNSLDQSYLIMTTVRGSARVPVTT